jgi:hypothetical protein
VHLDECENVFIGEAVRRDIRKMSIFHLLFDIEDDSCTKINEAMLEDVLGVDPVVVDEENKAMRKTGSKATISCCGSLNFF